MSIFARRRVRSSVAVAFLVLLFAGIAHASDLDDAKRAFAQGDRGTAGERLLTWLLGDDQDPASLLEAVRLAARMKDLDLLERAQGRTEIAMQDTQDPRLHLALALAYYTIASERLARGIQGPTLAMLFADAESEAAKAGEAPAYAAGGHELLARARWAQGDVDGAIDALAPYAGTGSGGLEGPPSLHLLRGRLLYDRAVTKELGEDGQPTDAGHADLEGALEALGHVVAHLPANASTADRSDLWLTLAWSAHRLGETGAAAHAYAQAWENDPESVYPLRGLESLFANRPDALAAALEDLARRRDLAPAALDALAETCRRSGHDERAVDAAERRIELDPEDPTGWTAAGGVLLRMGRREAAHDHLVQALRLDPASDSAARLLEATARSFLEDDRDRAFAVYDELLALRPADPYVRNNYGFILREAVSPHTTIDDDGIQTLRPDAPEEARRLLDRCVAVYREAAAAIDDGAEMDPKTGWVLAGIVNDYGLVLHYFKDVQDPLEAERQYQRALRMTDYGYMDTYLPNLRRLYSKVLHHRALSLYAVAREARTAILRERRTADGGFELVPDEQKRQVAARDVEALRAAVVKKLREDAEADEAPWPPK